MRSGRVASSAAVHGHKHHLLYGENTPTKKGYELVANFIRCTEDRGIGQQFVFVNVDHVTTARFDPATGILEFRVVGMTESVNVHGEEAKVAVKKLEGMM